MKKLNKTTQQEINDLFREMEKSLYKEYTEKDFQDMEREYKLLEKKKERCDYGR